ncbi:PEP-CTERM sorting domain-containing protein [Lacipirellula parvula]|uniref:Ice-binding protein C-terminal domain-containing protein n=1 Tax=Lacipirellula parvula TaxID=2650471 RepID=A0A5K7X9I4_9BACT|nr:PEP-CTERM sorting domain-containing protein [Lacipirellula parvula]BBO30986.1 hypothetical protein PLANPX_0598 [Lacipirellula parvula]
MSQRFVSACVLSLFALATVCSAQAAVYIEDDFNYPDGQLTSADATSTGTGANVSGGLWASHSGTQEFMQAAGGKAIVQMFGTEDINRATSGGQVLADGDTWYYALKFTVKDMRPEGDIATAIGSNYFIHFKDTGTFNFLGRLYVAAPTDLLQDKFTLELSSYSVNGTGGQRVRWGTDLSFDTEYTAVVSFTAPDDDAGTTTDGYSSLWVNPTTESSTSITDTMPHPDLFIQPDRDDVSQIALRQANAGNTQPQVEIDKLALGDSFADVLASVAGGGTFSPADFDHNGFVDANDLATWKTAYGSTPAGDANGDNVTNGADFLIWQQQFTGAAPPVASVPEPATISIGLAAAAGLIAASRRRRAS